MDKITDDFSKMLQCRNRLKGIPDLIDTSDSDSTIDVDEMDLKINEDIVKSILEEEANEAKKRKKFDRQEETAMRFANELLAEEREQKAKAKRKAKKKKRKEKKKQTDKQNSQPENSSRKSCDESDKSDEDDIDPTSAFVAAAASKRNVILEASNAELPTDDTKKSSKATPLLKEERKNDSEIKSLVQQAREKAVRGNEFAKVGKYKLAADMFTEAIKLDPADYRFFGNRSFCYELMKRYDRALADAETVISMAPKWPKGYFRKGRALVGLEKFTEAEEAFEQVIKRDKNCEDGMQELKKVRMKQIMDMGFTEVQAENAIQRHGNIAGALESLLGSFVDPHNRRNKVSSSPDTKVADPKVSVRSNTDVKVYPKNVFDQNVIVANQNLNRNNVTSLWVGNILPQVTDKQLAILFSRYGPVQSVKMISEKYCAFVDYKDARHAEKAMANLQGFELMGQSLTIRFPEHPVVYSGPQQNFILRKGTVTKTMPEKSVATTPRNATGEEAKRSGPVNGNECYYWRTTGCAYGVHCRNVHVPNHKGIDRKPWHKLPSYS